MKHQITLVCLLYCTACAQFEMPPLPLQMHIADDVDEADANAYRDAAQSWNQALGQMAIREVDQSTGGCGLYVVRGDGLKAGGFTEGVSDCRLRTMLRPKLSDPMSTAMHELAHAMMTATDADHSHDVHSIMYESGRPDQVLMQADIDRVMERLR